MGNNMDLFVPETTLIAMIECPKCGQLGYPKKNNPHICEDCARVEKQRENYIHTHNPGWMELAKDTGLELWERQPEETDREYQVWLCYRDAYPARKPTYGDIARQLNTTINVVKKVGQRWSFPTRMQAWVQHVDNITLRSRQEQIVAMNASHIALAEKARKKLESAIDFLDPACMKPGEVIQLGRFVTELERKARLDETVITPVQIDENNAMMKKSVTPTEDMAEILKILVATGALDAASAVGIKQTTEVVLKND